jgi:hypothetical protein
MREPRTPDLKVVPLSRPVSPEKEKSTGRPPKLKLPPLPQELLDGMTALEQEHFNFFLAAARAEFKDMTPFDQLGLVRAAVEYINLMRVEVAQLSSGQVLSQARQHPGVQLRAWLETMSFNRRAKLQGKKTEEKDPMQDFLSGLSRSS